MTVRFEKLIDPTTRIVEQINKWEIDPALIPFIRSNNTRDDQEKRKILTIKDLEQRLEHNRTYLIYLDSQLIGEMDYQIDPKVLYKKETGTAWIGILIGEAVGRGKGIGFLAMNIWKSKSNFRDCSVLSWVYLNSIKMRLSCIKTLDTKRVLESMILLIGRAKCGRISEWKNTFRMG